ncbi:class I SAM-dependent methyltransferase [Pseudaestuariivita sp.]|uniref:class I SAM-dependent methyltransferase n=1 Tax=Pseudaestuariivita sp. TaxID=2211669 RepID=UPI0040587B98
MTETLLIDRTALAQRRARRVHPKGLFLHEAARDEAEDRLSFIKKSFSAPGIVTPAREVWDGFAGATQIVPDTDTLDLAPEAHDLVIHAMGLHWANDPVGQLIQCRRALVPDGLLLVICLGGQTLGTLRAALATAETEVTGGLSPRVLPMGDVRDLGALLQRAGLALPVADSAPMEVRYQSPRHLMRDLRAMGEGNALNGRLRHFTRRAVFDRADALYPREGDGTITATYDLITLTGWAPSADQPQPLRPGSATTRLAEALGTSETPLKR